jgi:hypothetical protein
LLLTIAGPVGASLSSSSSLSVDELSLELLSLSVLEEDDVKSMKTGWCVQRARL